MEYKLEEYLKKFASITNFLLLQVEQENFDGLQLNLEERQKIIDEINGLSYDVKAFRNISEKYELTKLEEKLATLMKAKKAMLRVEMNKISKEKAVSKNYRKRNSVDSIFLNKKI